MIIPLCLKIIRSCLVYCVHIWDRVQERCWSKCCVKSLRWVGFQALAQWGEADGTELIQPGEGMALKGTISSPHFQYLRRSYKVGEARLSIELHSGEKTDSGHISEQLKFHSHYCFFCFVLFIWLVGFVLWKILSTETGCFCDLYAWRFPRLKRLSQTVYPLSFQCFEQELHSDTPSGSHPLQ